MNVKKCMHALKHLCASLCIYLKEKFQEGDQWSKAIGPAYFGRYWYLFIVASHINTKLAAIM